MGDKHVGQKFLDDILGKYQSLDDEHTEYQNGLVASYQKEFKGARGKGTKAGVDIIAKFMHDYKGKWFDEETKISDKRMMAYRGEVEQMAKQMGTSIDDFVDRVLKNDPQALGMLNNWHNHKHVRPTKEAYKREKLDEYHDDRQKVIDYMADMLKEDRKAFYGRFEDSGIDDAISHYSSAVKK